MIGDFMLKGIGTTKSVGIGKALVVKTIEVEAKRHQITDVKAEIACFIDIRERFVNETLKFQIGHTIMHLQPFHFAVPAVQSHR